MLHKRWCLGFETRRWSSNVTGHYCCQAPSVHILIMRIIGSVNTHIISDHMLGMMDHMNIPSSLCFLQLRSSPFAAGMTWALSNLESFIKLLTSFYGWDMC